MQTVMRSLAEARVKWAFSPPTEDGAEPLERLHGVWLRDGSALTVWHGDEDAESDEEEHVSGEEDGSEAEHNEDAASADENPSIPTSFGRFNVLVEGDDDAEEESDRDEEEENGQPPPQ